ncbi:SGNH/GDSL hydrolase family protein [Patulibacter americanus]|uniref:SGNH/GDSL hydrolase family protein n=1 Tax=Patulibacter americanus TaxID=588672 RepID=UPI0003B355B8|nr:SGNH/GDSL hydrolase family protein [Patulibacter americanus]
MKNQDASSPLVDDHREPTLLSHPIGTDVLRGLADLERTERGWLPHRLPARARAQSTDPQLAGAESQPSGVRLAFRTRSTVVEVDTVRTRVAMTGVPDRPEGTVDLRIDGRLAAQATTAGGDVVEVDLATGATALRPGDMATTRFDGLSSDEKDVEIWLPHHERTELVALRTDAPIAAPSTDGRPVWVHHGSSISQGSNAASPSTTWPAVAAALGGVQLVNLGFGGSAMLDPFVARAMRDAPADVLSVEIGINLVNSDVMRLRAVGPAVHGFLDTLRDGHPDVPLIVIGPLFCPIHEHTPGPGAFDVEALAEGRVRFRATGDPVDPASPTTPLSRLTLTLVREVLARIVADRRVDDPQLSYVDGLDLYGPDDEVERPLPDALHPDAPTHRIIGERFARRGFAAGRPGV